MLPIDPLVSRIADALTTHNLGWAIAGGWAIDLFLGHVTRPHADVDIAVWRDEHERLREAMPDWRFSVADEGQLRPWPPGRVIAPPLHELHARSLDDGSSVEFLLNDRRDGAWLYRRNSRIRLPLSDAIRDEGPMRFLAPEVVLLYKSKAPRATDEADFNNALPHLSKSARYWLAHALGDADMSHPWLATLRHGIG